MALANVLFPNLHLEENEITVIKSGEDDDDDDSATVAENANNKKSNEDTSDHDEEREDEKEEEEKMAEPVGMTKFGRTIYKPTCYRENKMANTAYAGSDGKDDPNIMDLFLKIKNSDKAHNQEVLEEDSRKLPSFG